MGEGKPLGLPEQSRANTVVSGSVGDAGAGSSRSGLPFPSPASPAPSQLKQEDL